MTDVIEVTHQEIETLTSSSFGLFNYPVWKAEDVSKFMAVLETDDYFHRSFPWSKTDPNWLKDLNQSVNDMLNNSYGFILPKEILPYGQEINLAWRVIHSGFQDHVIGIGVSVVCDGQRVGRLIFPCLTKTMLFSEKVFNGIIYKSNFKGIDILRNLYSCNMDIDYDSQAKIMINSFFIFKSYWEKVAQQNRVNINIVFNSNLSDAMYVNKLYQKYLPSDVQLLTYNPTKWENNWETHSQNTRISANNKKLIDVNTLMVNILKMTKTDEVKYTYNDYLGNELRELYSGLSFPVELDNMIDDDAYKIAQNMDNVNRIMTGRARLKFISALRLFEQWIISYIPFI